MAVEANGTHQLRMVEFDRLKGRMRVLDQLLLPHQHVYIEVEGVEGGWKVIRDMNVRGAPAIAIVACFSLATELLRMKLDNKLVNFWELVGLVNTKLDYLDTSRPTAVNLKNSTNEIRELLTNHIREGNEVNPSSEKLVEEIANYSEKLYEEDLQINLRLGKFGAEKIMQSTTFEDAKVRILTHCNTGSLATSGYGTALGVIRTLHAEGKLERAFCTETRPYNQGSRLTAYELVYEQIPSTYVCDSAAAALMKEKKIDGVVVGADRVVCNGDTANKIGTLALAISASFFGIPFYVACPTTTIDWDKETGRDVVIEERNANEMVTWATGPDGKQTRQPPEGIEVWNPAFDITPAELITGGIITEFGVFTPPLNKYEIFGNQ